jgi:L-fucose isomerase-like protein
MNNWGANHGAISYGHIGADLNSLASMLSIPVCMHNVDEKNIFVQQRGAHLGLMLKVLTIELVRLTALFTNKYSNCDLTDKFKESVKSQ